MSSDQYLCGECRLYRNILDMHKDVTGKFLCKQCAAKYEPIYLAPAKPDNSHYKMGGIDPCQYVEAMGTAEFRGACVLNILKYITRYPYKGTPLEDLAKAQDYLNKLIEHERAK